MSTTLPDDSSSPTQDASSPALESSSLTAPLAKGDSKTKARSAIGVVIVSCIAALQFGYNTAVMSGALHPLLKTFWPCFATSVNLQVFLHYSLPVHYSIHSLIVLCLLVLV